MLLARAIRLVVGIVIAIIAVAVVLRLLDANASNAIVSDIHDAGASLVGPFSDLFSIKNPKVNMVVNWGLAALVYAVIGGFIASFAARGAAAAQSRRAGYGRRRGYAGDPDDAGRPWYARRRGFGRTRPVA
jgi:hypothetical protein